MKIPYTFSVLRYVHDPVSMEFVNVGVAVYAPDVEFARAVCTPHYGRLSRMFGRVDGERFRQTLRFVKGQIDAIGEGLSSQLPFPGQPNTVETLLAQVLPPDDSAIQFSPSGGGFTSDVGQTLNDLYERYVERYAARTVHPSRDDQDVWRVFRRPLAQRGLMQRLRPKRIVAPNYEYEFKEAWRNEVWHAYEPVSFDLVEPSSIVDKANTWVGRITSLAESKEQFKPYLLLGEPRENKLRGSFAKALNILHKMPCEHEFIREEEAEDFAKELEAEISKH